MSDGRLAAELEATGLLRRVQAQGDFATLLRKGDPHSGALLLLITSRGAHFGCLERVLNLDGRYAWQRCGPPESASSADVRDFLARRTRFDPDLWAIELDIAAPERFIAETTASG
ncbi:hypothetical protein ACUXST_001835 [Sphingomonas sp. F9_3S_D5_B_2]